LDTTTSSTTLVSVCVSYRYTFALKDHYLAAINSAQMTLSQWTRWHGTDEWQRV